MSVSPRPKLTIEKERELRRELKRCSEETIEAVFAYRNHGDIKGLTTIVKGIAESFLEPEKQGVLHTVEDNASFTEDLGIDSLTMLEIVWLLDDALDVGFENEELRDLHTVGELKELIIQKIKNPPEPPARTAS